jgi:hypothetical protein
LLRRSYFSAFGCCKQLKPWSRLRTAATPTLPPRKGRIAFFSLTSGAANTALGRFSLHSVTTGFNTGIDAGTLVLNTGGENTAIWTAALLLNTASSNTAVASRALLNNTTGGTLTNIQRIDVGPNVAVGQQGLESNTVVGANTAVGYQALHSFISGPMGFEPLGLPILSPAIKTVNPTACAITR